MGWSTVITVWRDPPSRCGRQEDVRNVVTVEQAREKLARYGWTVEDGQDRCPAHRAKPRSFAEIVASW